MSNPNDLREWIPDFIAGRLDAESSQKVSDHLARNPEDRALASRWTAIARGMRESGELLLSSHPATEALRSFAERKTGSEESRQEIARHVKTCASCSLEVAVLGDRPAAPKPVSPPVRVARSAYTMIYRFASLAAAAGIVLGIGLGVLYESRGPGQPAWSGAVGLVTLDPSLRGDEAVATFELDAAQPFVPMVVAPMLPAETDDPEAFRFSIMDRGQEVIWSTDLEAGEIRQHLDQAGVVTLLVPTNELSGGRYTLEIRALEPADSLPLFEVPFEIRRSGPPGG